MAQIVTPIGSNINTYGDSGTFESAYSGSSWGSNFGTWPTYATTVTRSSDVAKQGTYSCKVLKTVYGRQALLNNIAYFQTQDFKRYRVTCWVYVASSNPLTTTIGTGTFRLLFQPDLNDGSNTGKPGYFSIGCTVNQCTNNWFKLEMRMQANTSGVVNNFVHIDFDNGIVPENGAFYIDQIEIFEILESYINYEITGTVTNALGPESATGSVSLSASPSGIYEYSKDDGATWQLSNTFGSLLPGSYVFAIAVNSGGPKVAQTTINVGISNPTWNFNLVGTNETSPGAGDGIITVNVSDNSGSPYTYRITTPAGSSTSGTNVFSSLDPGTYSITVKDTYGNQRSKSITLLDAPTCSLTFQDVEITKATDDTTSDGEISLHASDSVYGGTTWYKIFPASASIPDFTYPNGDNTTGEFTGLSAGDYIIAARTSTTCYVANQFTVGIETTYATRFRLEFNSIDRNSFIDYNNQSVEFGANNQFRLDVEEANYLGSIEEVIGSSTPVMHSWRGEGNQNPFENTVVASELQVSFISESNLYFIDLFTSDEKKFRYKFYLYNQWSNGFILLFQGFHLPMIYEEAYVDRTNYEVSFVATDGLRNLDGFEFSDDSGNYFEGRMSMIKAIAACLKKTGSRLYIHDMVNIYTEGMDSGLGSLAQRYFDPIVYKNSDGTFQDCLTVLNSLLLGCNLYQANGVWNIELVSDKCNTTLYKNIFDHNGDFISTESTPSKRILLRNASSVSPKVVFTGQPRLKVAQTFGSVKCTYNLGIEEENNLLRQGTFEAVDPDNGQLVGWSVNLDIPERIAIVKSPGREGNCLAVVFQNNDDGLPYVFLTSETVEIRGTSSDFKLKLSFDLYTIPVVTNTYIWFDYRMYIDSPNGRYYLQHILDYDSGLPAFQQGTTALVNDEGFIRVHIDNHAVWKTYEIETLVEFGGFDDTFSGDLKVEFRFFNNALWDVDSFVDLAAVTTNNYARKKFDNRRRVPDAIPPSFIYFYELEPTSETEIFPNVVEPDDYSDSKWILKKTLSVESDLEGWLQSILIDNVKVSYYPEEEEPETEIINTEVINQNTSGLIEIETIHGDVLQDVLDFNYKHLMNGHWTLADGTITTGGWFRKGTPSERKLYHELLVKMWRGQFQIPRWLLMGDLDTREKIIDFSATIHELRTGRVYLPLSISNDYKNMVCSIEMRESVLGIAVDETVSSGGADSFPNPESGDDVGAPVGSGGGSGNIGQHSSQHSPEHS